jgi:unsaturated chondroitin disaccharide hydrolase
MLARIQDTAGRVVDGFPHWADPETGQWVTTPDGDWTGGYWVGMLWLAGAATGDARYRSWAAPLAERLRVRIDAHTVFKSFPVYYGAALGAILHDAPGPREIALQTARSLARLYAPALRLVPLGAQAEEGAHVGGTETSIDSLQAAPFLFWAAGVTGDAALREVATNHAETIIHLHLRADGSFIQSSSLDAATGRLVRHYTHKGVSDTSTWGRAQAWGMLFSTQSYLADRGREAWIAAAVRGADWWLAHVPADRVAFWDFDDPAIPRTERDTAATAIALAALLRLGQVAPSPAGRSRYRQAAEATARALVDGYLTPTRPDDRRVPGMLTEACFNKRADARPQDRANRCEFIVGSYYLFESLLGLAGRIESLRV